MNTKLKGYLLAIVAAASYGMNPLFALPLYQDGMDTTSVLFFRYLIAIPLIALMLRWRGRSLRLHRKEAKPLLVLGVLMAISSITLFQSYNFMAAGIASTILFVYPIMVALIMAVWYKEKLSVQTVVCLLLALVGIGLLYKGEDGATLSLIGTLLVLGSSLSYALYIVCANQRALRDVPTLRITLYVLIIALFIFALMLLGDGSISTPQHWYMWGNLIGMAIFPTIISFGCTTAAVQYVGSTPTAILGALEPVTAIIFGITIFGETLTPRDCLGLLLIIVAVTLVVAGGSITTHLVRFRKLFPRLPRKKRLLFLGLPLLLPACMQAQSEVMELRPDKDETVTNEAAYTKIFLAGTIDMGNSVDWQKATCEWFRMRSTGKYILYNPRREKGLSGEMSDFERQVNWELEHLEKADLIIMNILASSKSPITLLEMGLYMRSRKLYVVCEPGFYRYDNVRITCQRYGVPLYHSMEALFKEAFAEVK